jgi:hypothetical protein
MNAFNTVLVAEAGIWDRLCRRFMVPPDPARPNGERNQ